MPVPSNPAPPGDRAGGGAGGAEPAESAGLGSPGPCALRSRLASAWERWDWKVQSALGHGGAREVAAGAGTATRV